MKIEIGLEVLLKNGFKDIAGKNIGLLANPASVDSSLKSAIDIFLKTSKQGIFNLKKLFGPQQGLFEAQQANMTEWEGSIKSRWGIPVHSLYGKTRKPTPEMLEAIDSFVVDLQDVGAKGYTFASTLFYVMEASEEAKVEVIVLDRPNPLGRTIEGPVTQNNFKSFVGIHNLPLKHGLTIGEMALLFQKEVLRNVKLKIIKMRFPTREMLFPSLGRIWIPTSPNMPTFDTVIVYPGMELLEGTNISEGRGTTRPFEQFGAPFIDPFKLQSSIEKQKVPGCKFRPVSFNPTFDKWKGQDCYGLFIHVTDPKKFKPIRSSLEILRSIIKLYPDKFSFNSPPYEYEREKMPFDILVGNSYVREELKKGTQVNEIEKAWSGEIKSYEQRIQKVLIYNK